MSVAIQYQLDSKDMEAFFRHHASHAPYIVARNQRMRWIWSGLFALMALLYFLSSLKGGLAFLALAVVYLLFYGRLNRWWYVRHNRRIHSGPDGPRLGPVKLELVGEHLLVEGAEGSSRLQLSAIRRVDESESHYFIYLGPVAAVVLPKSAAGVEAFLEELRSARGAA